MSKPSIFHAAILLHCLLHITLTLTHKHAWFTAMAVDHSKFRTCEQTGFCRRHRHRIPLIHYTAQNVQLKNSKEACASIDLVPSHDFGGTLHMKLYFLKSGVARVKIQDETEQRVTYDDEVLNLEDMIGVDVEDIIMIQDTQDMEDWMLKDAKCLGDDNDGNNCVVFQYTNDQNISLALLIQLKPQLELYFYNASTQRLLTSVNTQQRMYYEHHRDRQQQQQRVLIQPNKNNDHHEDRHQGKEVVGYWEDGLAIYADGSREEHQQHSDSNPNQDNDIHDNNHDHDLWEETFQGHTDSKPNGPTSVGIDITLHTPYIYGLPEHATSMALQATTSHSNNDNHQEPYRLYNLDVFEYELQSNMALYGAVPLVVGQGVQEGCVGVFVMNPSESFVDVMDTHEDQGSRTIHWMSESGILDLFLLPGGPTAHPLYHQYALLTSTPPIPPLFSLGYHQCRWNYNDMADVHSIHSHFELYDYPYDVLWLDIEHTDGKRYMTWDKEKFGDPIKMQKELWSDGRRMVTIVDPHIKRDEQYRIHKEATQLGYYIKTSDHKDYDGWCWPGASSYLDFTSSTVRQWWAEQFAYDKYLGSTPSLFTWNDMNEPSVFNGPEVSMQKDLLNLAGVEHREWHNLYGMLFHRATMEGLIQRNNNNDNDHHNIRPFVLSRSFFAGSQRYGAIWTGDNAAKWDHLQMAAPMLLSLNIGGLSFVGADVGGFFGNPDAELMTRWTQAAAYQPFFRGHAHHDSKRREPWMFGEDTLHRLRKVTAARYALLPYWYTVFNEAMVTGMPVMRAMWMEFATATDYSHVMDMDDQWMVGKDLLVKPVTSAGVVEVDVYLPSSCVWYDVDTMMEMNMNDNGNESIFTVQAPIDKIPVYQRGGSIIPRKLRLRRSTHTMSKDPYTFYVALDRKGQASGTLYLDDETTFNYKKGKYGNAYFRIDAGVLVNEYKGNYHIVDGGVLERIVIMGMDEMPSNIWLRNSGSKETTTSADAKRLVFSYDAASKVLVIRKPDVLVTENWEISIEK